ncbi:hypothetical protein, partial [Myxococcus eversor]|uniref:hypothetical protein n=1 Tax=Myxococcus eversor TaxID=2709661 RepID=UPI0019684C2E
MASIFDMLRLVEKYPQAFLIDSEKERELQLRTLEAVIIGYSSASKRSRGGARLRGQLGCERWASPRSTWTEDGLEIQGRGHARPE